MATSADKFSKGYEGKRKTRKGGGSSRRREVAGPYRSESSVPSIRRKSRRSEHRAVPPRSSRSKSRSRTPSASEVFPASTLRVPTKKELRQRLAAQSAIRKALRPLAPKRTAQRVPTATARMSTGD